MTGSAEMRNAPQTDNPNWSAQGGPELTPLRPPLMALSTRPYRTRSGARTATANAADTADRRKADPMGNNIWLVLIVIFIVLALLGVVTIAA